MPTLDYVDDWYTRLLGRLYTQYRGKVTWEKWVALLARQFQDLEDSGQTLFSILDIDNGVGGVQLDLIGRLVGRARRGVIDSTYRLYLKAQIIANRSSGTAENIYDVFRALFGTDARPVYELEGEKQFSVRLRKVITDIEAAVAAEFLGIAKEAGARGILEWQPDDDDGMFTFDAGTTPTGFTSPIPGLGYDEGEYAGAELAGVE